MKKLVDEVMDEMNAAPEIVKLFTAVAHDTDLNKAVDFMSMFKNLLANSVGVLLMRKLVETCDCPDCKDSTKEMLASYMNDLHEHVKQCVDGNLIANGHSALFDPNASVREEILKEAENDS